jgi:uncharacterized protein YaaQ
MAIDFSPLTAPVPESGTNKGMTFLSNALDAVLQRRAQMEQQRAQLEAQAARDHMIDQREQLRLQQEAQHARELEAQARAENQRKAQHDQQIEDIAKQTRQEAAIKDAMPMFATPGQESGGLARLQASGIGIKPMAANVPPEMQQPVAQPEHVPDAPGGGAEWAAQAYQESQAQTQELQRRQQVEQAQAQARGRYTLDFGGGRTQDLDARAMGPEGQAERIAAVIPMMDPVDAAAVRRQQAMQQAGMMKPEAAAGFVEAGVGRRENNAAALERAKIAGSARRNELSAGEGARLKDSQVKGWEGAYGNWEKTANVDKLTDAKTKADQASALAAKFREGGSSVSQRAALYNTAREIVGPGTLQESEFRNTVTNSTGILGLLKTQADRFMKGEISDQEMQALEQYLKDSQAIVRKKAVAALANFDKKFSEKTYYGQGVPTEVAATRAALVDRFGLSRNEDEASRAGKTGAEHMADKLLRGKK